MPLAASGASSHSQRARSSAAWLLPCLLAFAACNVYTAELVGDAGSTIDGQGSGSAGKSSLNVGGKSNSTSGGAGSNSTTGGTEGDPMGAGGAGAEGGAGEAPGTSGAGGSDTPQAGTGGGGSGTSGGGSGGTPITVPETLIDGFEDQDITLEQTAGRGGVWYLFDDGTTGEAGPEPLACSELTSAPAALGAFALNITATGFTGWGSGLGVDFRAGKKVYDGSKYTGIRFWARVGEGKNTRHRVQLVDGTSDALGGNCDPAADAPEGTKCDDHFGIDLLFTSTWTEYSIPFADLTQVGWGHSAPSIDTSALYGLQVTAKAKLNVDLWLDQIEFY